MKPKAASAVGSLLFREMKPDPPPATDVIGPGFSNRNKISAFTPPVERVESLESPNPNAPLLSVRDKTRT